MSVGDTRSAWSAGPVEAGHLPSGTGPRPWVGFVDAVIIVIGVLSLVRGRRGGAEDPVGGTLRSDEEPEDVGRVRWKSPPGLLHMGGQAGAGPGLCRTV